MRYVHVAHLALITLSCQLRFILHILYDIWVNVTELYNGTHMNGNIQNK